MCLLQTSKQESKRGKSKVYTVFIIKTLQIIVVYIVKIIVYVMIRCCECYGSVCVKNSYGDFLYIIVVFVMNFCGKEKL